MIAYDETKLYWWTVKDDNCDKHVVCGCTCHSNPGTMHIMACCSNCRKCGRKNVKNPTLMIRKRDV